MKPHRSFERSCDCRGCRHARPYRTIQGELVADLLGDPNAESHSAERNPAFDPACNPDAVAQRERYFGQNLSRLFDVSDSEISPESTK